MNLTLYFRLICLSRFQAGMKTLEYDKDWFHCPNVYAMDGFNVSLQIHHTNYCESENGYRKLGHTWETVEFGFPSQDEPLMHPYAEEPERLTSTVGRIPVIVMDAVFDLHGGVDWSRTISVESYNRFVHGN